MSPGLQFFRSPIHERNINYRNTGRDQNRINNSSVVQIVKTTVAAFGISMIGTVHLCVMRRNWAHYVARQWLIPVSIDRP